MLLLLLSLVQSVLSADQAVSSTVSFWHITDVHVDPYYVVGAKVNVQYYIRHLFHIYSAVPPIRTLRLWQACALRRPFGADNAVRSYWADDLFRLTDATAKLTSLAHVWVHPALLQKTYQQANKPSNSATRKGIVRHRKHCTSLQWQVVLLLCVIPHR